MAKIRARSTEGMHAALTRSAAAWVVDPRVGSGRHYGALFGVVHALCASDESAARALAENPRVVGCAAELAGGTHVLLWWQCLPDPGRPERVVSATAPHEGDAALAREHAALFDVFMNGGWPGIAHDWAHRLGQSTEPHPHLEALYLESFSQEIRALRALGRFDEARDRADDHIGVTSDRFGTELDDGSIDAGESLEATAAWRNSAYVELDDGCFEMAADLLEEVLRITLLHVAEDHPDALNVLFNLARAYMGLEAYEEAIERHQRCFELRRESLGLSHVDTIRSWKTLLDEEAGEDCGSIDALWSVATTSLGPHHPEVIDVLRLRARSQVSDHLDPAAAWRMFDDCIARLEAAPAMDHDALIRVIADMARLHRMEGNFDDALTQYRRLQQAFSDHYGPANPKTIEVGIPIAYVQFDRDQVDEGIAMLQETVDRFEDSDDSPPYWVTGTLDMLADACAEHGQPDRAVAAWRRIMELEEDAEEPDGDIPMKLGTLLAATGAHAEALTLLSDALDAIDEDEHDPAVLIPAMNALAELQPDDPDAAAAWRQRAADVQATWDEEWGDEE